MTIYSAYFDKFDEVEDTDDDDNYREGEVREKHDLIHEAPKLYTKTQTRSGLRRGFYKYGEGHVLGESNASGSGHERRLKSTPHKGESKGGGQMESGSSANNSTAVQPDSATTGEPDAGGSTVNST